MATPALRLLRDNLPRTTIDVLTKPPVDQVLDGLSTINRVRTSKPRTVRQRLSLASLLRNKDYDAALLLSNGFSSAAYAALARIPRRVGYARDSRSALLTDRLIAPKRPGSTLFKPKWALIPAARYYLDAAAALLCIEPPNIVPLMELAVTPTDEAEARRLLHQASVRPDQGFAVLNPGGNNEAKRWPAERFAQLARHLATAHGLAVLINGSPAESVLTGSIARASGAISLPAIGGSIPGLKALLSRASLLVTNDTGPRHIAAAFGTPAVSLFGPTDHRWTTIPTRPLADGSGSEVILLADPDLPENELANDHPQRCRIDRIELASVVEASDRLLAATTA